MYTQIIFIKDSIKFKNIRNSEENLIEFNLSSNDQIREN